MAAAVGSGDCCSLVPLSPSLPSASLPIMSPVVLSPTLHLGSFPPHLLSSLNIFPVSEYSTEYSTDSEMLLHYGKLCISQLVRRRHTRSHRGRGRDWCGRVTTVRLSSTLVPLGGTCSGNFLNKKKLPLLQCDIYLNGIFSLYSHRPLFKHSKKCMQGRPLPNVSGPWLHEFKDVV